MAEVLLKSVSLVSFILLGYLLKRTGLFGAGDYRIPMKIVLNITLPCAVIVSFASYPPDSSLLLVVFLAFAANCLMLGIAFILSRHFPRNTRLVWLNCTPSYNIGAFALPFVQSFLGPAGLVATCLFDTGNALMCNGTTYALSLNTLDGTKGLNLKRIGVTLLHSVPFLTYFTLLLITLFGLSIPQGFVNFVTPAANANAFLAMLMVGMMFDLHVEKTILRQMVVILALRFGSAVALAAAFYFLLPLPLEIRQALTVTVFAPVSMTSTALTVNGGGDPALAAGVNSISILICIVSTLTLLTICGVV